MIKEFLRRDGFEVCTGVAGGNAVEQLLFPQNPHRCRCFLIDAASSPAICCFFESLQADGRNEVPHPQHFISKGFVNQRSVSEAQEDAVRMLLAEADQIILSHQRLSACIYVKIHP